MISHFCRPPDVDLVVAVDEIFTPQNAKGCDRIEVTITEADAGADAHPNVTTRATYEYRRDDPGEVADRFIVNMKYAQWGNADGAQIYRPHPDALKAATVRASDRREGALAREVAEEIRDRLRRGDADR